jgi:hypothetical protein
MPGVSQHSSPGGGLLWQIPQAVVAAVSVCDSRVTTVGETCVETSY